MIGAYITIGILVLVVLLVLWVATYPMFRKYHLVLKKVEPKKKRHTRTAKKKRKQVWIKVI